MESREKWVKEGRGSAAGSGTAGHGGDPRERRGGKRDLAGVDQVAVCGAGGRGGTVSKSGWVIGPRGAAFLALKMF